MNVTVPVTVAAASNIAKSSLGRVKMVTFSDHRTFNFSDAEYDSYIIEPEEDMEES
jgi:hypothetical protein